MPITLLLDDVEVFLAHGREQTSPNVTWTLPAHVGLFCSTCGDLRRVNGLSKLTAGTKWKAPILTHFNCVQCDALFTGVTYVTTKGAVGYALLPSRDGGLTTPGTPPAVAHYLDQAHKCEAVGANSAAIAMYRGALEHLLFQQGFEKGMLGKKLADLEAKIAAATAPKWARDLETEFLDILKDLGNGAIHPNDGDVLRQAALDTEIVTKVKVTFMHLLFLVYELDSKKAMHLSDLRKAVSLLTK